MVQLKVVNDQTITRTRVLQCAKNTKVEYKLPMVHASVPGRRISGSEIRPEYASRRRTGAACTTNIISDRKPRWPLPFRPSYNMCTQISRIFDLGNPAI